MARIGKSSISENSFSRFNLEEETILRKEYLTEYFQEDYAHKIKSTSIRVKNIYETMQSIEKENIALIKRLKENYVKNFEKVFPVELFRQNINKSKCCYCEITKSEIEQLIVKRQINKKVNRGFNLEMERFDSNLEYTDENCDMACYWCNNAKTDEFTKDEFKEIAKEIRAVWESRKKIKKGNKSYLKKTSLPL